MWDKKKLKQISKRKQGARNEAGPKVEHAALLYARWQGMTHEDKPSPQKAKAELDLLLDTMEPEEWKGLDRMANEIGEPAIRGLMAYSLRRASTAVKEQAQAVRRMGDWPLTERAKRKKDKERDR